MVLVNNLILINHHMILHEIFDVDELFLLLNVMMI